MVVVAEVGGRAGWGGVGWHALLQIWSFSHNSTTEVVIDVSLPLAFMLVQCSRCDTIFVFTVEEAKTVR